MNPMERFFVVPVCAGLVTIEEGKVSIVHYTTQDHLEGKGKEVFPEAQIEITRTSVTCLSFDEYGVDNCYIDNLKNKLLREVFPSSSKIDHLRDDNSTDHPFIEYAARYWGRHACGDPEQDQNIRGLILRYLAQDIKVSYTVEALDFQIEGTPRDCLDYLEGTHGLRLATHFRLMSIISHFLANGTDINISNIWFETPLHRAAMTGEEALVQILLDKGANVKATTVNGGSALHQALYTGNSRLLQQLLDNGADVNSEGYTSPEIPDIYHHTVLYKSVSSEDEAVMHVLLEHGAYSMVGFPSALQAATGTGSSSLGQLPLNNGADIESKDLYGETLLSWTVKFREGYEVAQMLLDNWADAAIKDYDGLTPMHGAAAEENDEASQIFATNTLGSETVASSLIDSPPSESSPPPVSISRVDVVHCKKETEHHLYTACEITFGVIERLR
ncbi:MAG: hypothetical protein M1827_004854 [Pycnora praestabilis]|nr:MAG: hypothetical protein M1827_004854 [Pycnora praestabilis]